MEKTPPSSTVTMPLERQHNATQHNRETGLQKLMRGENMEDGALAQRERVGEPTTKKRAYRKVGARIWNSGTILHSRE